MRDVYILGGVRTAIGRFGGALKSIEPCDLGAQVCAEALRRTEMAAAAVEHVVVGNVIHTTPRDMYISRVVALNAGMPIGTPALTVNRLCGSGLQAIVSAAQMIMLGDASVTLAAGVENMSRAGHLLSSMRWGQRLGAGQMHDMLLGALQDPFGHGHMGVTAENLAKRYTITREQQDAYALESHKRAAHALEQGFFATQIMPITVGKGSKSTQFLTDEHVRQDADMEHFSSLSPCFQTDQGTVTAGNASGINDGAAALVLVDAKHAQASAVKPSARILGYTHSGVAPEEMGMGPVPAVQQLLQKLDLRLDDIDIIESSEAFAAQACAVNQALNLSSARVNPNGGAISLGHPIGATGAVIVLKLMYELQRTSQRIGIATMCIGGGQGIALAIESLV